MYSFKSRVRFSEVDADQNMMLTSILDYFQDCAVFHGQNAGLDIDELNRMGYAWILSSWQVIVDRYPKFGEEITISTWAYDFKDFYGYRNLKIEDANGEVVAYANSIWIFMDIQKGRPSRLPERVQTAYGFDPQLPMDTAPRKIALPKEMEAAASFPVHKFHIDAYQHVNNEKYVLMAQEYLPTDFIVHQMRVEYRKSAVYGDIIYPFIQREDGKILISLADEKGKAYAVVEFLQRQAD